MKIIRAIGVAFLLAFLPAHSPAEGMPWESSAINLETGILWGVGNSTPLSYRIVPIQTSWRSPRAFGRELKDGSHLLVRHRVTLITDWIQSGPESLYAAFSFSPSIEWWNPAGTCALVGGAGGGCGFIDSQGVAGGQGQDFTLNYFFRGGVERIVDRNLSLTAGVLFQHLSNGGRTDPNPGLNGFGFTVGASWRF